MKRKVYEIAHKKTKWYQLKTLSEELTAAAPLAWQLVKKELRTDYRQTFLGFFWAFFMPLSAAFTWLLLHSSGVISHHGSTQIPYGQFVFVSVLIWSVFSDSIMSPVTYISSKSQFIARVHFPKEALILVSFYKTLFSAGIKLLMLIVASIGFGKSPAGSWLWLPLCFFSLFLCGSTLGLILAPIGLLYKDIQRLAPLFIQFVMFLTPVFYAPPPRGALATVNSYNPLTNLISIPRNILLEIPGQELPFSVIFWTITGSTVAIILMWRVFRTSYNLIIQRI